MGEKGLDSSKPIRVLQIIGVVCGGGVEAVIMNYYRHIDRTKIQFDFVIDGYGKSLLDDEITSLGGRIYKVEPYTHNIFKYMYQIYRIITDNNYSIIHSNMNTIGFFSLLPAWMAGTHIRVLHNHSTAVKGEGFRTIIKYFLRPFAPLFANRYAACSKKAGLWMYGKKKMDSGKVRIINNAIDIGEFSFNPAIRKSLRRRMKIDDDTVVIGHIGRFMYQKNHIFLIDVFKKIKERKPNSILLLIGDGELKLEIEKRVLDENIQDSVRFLGLRRDVKDLYNVMDVFMLPSWYEGLPVVSIEAQANGLKCFFSDKITDESKLLSSTIFLKITDGVEPWVKAFLKDGYKRNTNASKILMQSGLDISENCKSILKWYSE